MKELLREDENHEDVDGHCLDNQIRMKKFGREEKKTRSSQLKIAKLRNDIQRCE